MTLTSGVVPVDLTTNTLLPRIAIHRPIRLTATPDGAFIYAVHFRDARIAAIDTASNTVASTLPVNGAFFALDATPDGRHVFAGNGRHLSIIDVATQQMPGPDLPVANFVAALTIGPSVIVPNATPLNITSDADLAPHGFVRDVPFNGGTLRLTGPWSTTRNVSIWSTGGAIDTNGFDARIEGGVRHEGLLTKIGAGTLSLAGTGTAAGTLAETSVFGGTLLVDGSHPAIVTIDAGATLAGAGSVGRIRTFAGATVSPGSGDRAPGILTATQADLGAGATVIVDLNGPVAGTGYDRLEVSGTATLDQPTLVLRPGSADPIGRTFTIVTNAAGRFANLAEGGVINAGGRHFRITYQGGDGNDIVLTLLDVVPPQTAPPTITGLSDQIIGLNSALGPIGFTVGDDATPADALGVIAVSSDQALLPDANIVLGGIGTARTLTATPLAGASGAVRITVSVSDGEQTAEQTFTLTVLSQATYYLAEGSTGVFFDTDILLANPNTVDAPATLTFFKEDGTTVTRDLVLARQSRSTVRVDDIAGLESTAFSTLVTSTTGVPLVVERTMRWDASGYGAHTEKAAGGASTRWYSPKARRATSRPTSCW